MSVTSANTAHRVAVVGTRGMPNVQGGVERHCEELYPRVASRELSVVVYARSGYVESSLSWNGISIRVLPTVRLPGVEALVHTAIAIVAARAAGADTLHIHSCGPAALTSFARVLGFRRIVVTLHAPDYEQQKWGRAARWLLKRGERSACRHADDVICVAEWYSQRLEAEYERTIDFLPNGPGLTGFTPNPVGDILLRNHLLGVPYVLFVGRLIPDKRVEDLIQALRRVPEAPRLVIAGESADTDAYAMRLGSAAESSVLFLGTVRGQDLADLYGAARVFVLPSTREGLPIALLEAMNFGVPTVSTDISANTEVLGDAGLSYPAGDVDALSRTLRRLLNDETLRTQLGAAGRRRVKAVYDWNAIARATQDIYRRVR